MRIILTEHFQKDTRKVSRIEKDQILDVILILPHAVKDVHRHSGIGMRKIHPSGIFEARVGLGLRMVFAFERDTLILHRLGTHEDIHRYLKNL